jgi:hypothetical protein
MIFGHVGGAGMIYVPNVIIAQGTAASDNIASITPHRHHRPPPGSGSGLKRVKGLSTMGSFLLAYLMCRAGLNGQEA